MTTIPERKVKLVEVDGEDLEYETEVNLSLEKIFSETNMFGQQNLFDVINYVRNNASIVNFLDSADNLVTTNVGAWTDIPDMEITPANNGTYIVMAFIVTSHSSNNGLASFALAKNGIREASTVTNISYSAKNTSLVIPMIKVEIADDVADTFTMQWIDVSGTVRATNRYLFMIRISE